MGVENQTEVVYKTSGWYWWSYGSKPNKLDDFIQHHKQKSSWNSPIAVRIKQNKRRIILDKRPKRITNKYFNSNGNKEEKQPLTHYPQGNRTSNYYCKSNP